MNSYPKLANCTICFIQTDRNCQLPRIAHLGLIGHGVLAISCHMKVRLWEVRLCTSIFYVKRPPPYCPIHVVTFTLISNLATDYIKKKEESLASSLLNIICHQNWYQRKSDYMDRAEGCHLMVLSFALSPVFQCNNFSQRVAKKLRWWRD